MTLSEMQPPDKPHVRVIGPPRSGTNLVKYLIETHTDLTCWFNRGWWKHAIIPPLMQQTASIAAVTPTIIVFRDPIMQMASFYKFSRQGRTELSGASDLQSFLRSPIEMISNEDHRYIFSSPIDYWVQFYYSVLNWNMNKKYYVDLEKLKTNPQALRDMLYRLFNSEGLSWPPFETPNNYLGPNPDQHVSKGLAYENTTLTEEEQANQAILANFSAEDRALVLTERVISIHADLCARSCV